MQDRLNLENTEVAFQARSDSKLRQSYWIFRLMNSPFLVQNGTKFLNLSFKLGVPLEGLVKSTVFKQFCGGESIAECAPIIARLAKYKIGTILDFGKESGVSEKDFEKVATETLKTIDLAARNPNIPFTVFKPSGIARHGLMEKIQSCTPLSAEERAEWAKAESRFERICEHAFNKNIRLLIDAEESWIQGEVDRLALSMMRKFNRKEAIIFNTVQMYRKDRLQYIDELLTLAKSEQFWVGLKIVRGAYLEKESDRAKTLGYLSPLCSTKDMTDRQFDQALSVCMTQLDRVAICCGTHNQLSTSHLSHLIQKGRLSVADARIYFAQLYGMSDHLSYNLARAGYNVAKYLPYGPVRSLVPYLVRRAQENTSIAGQTSRELLLIEKERDRRHQLYLKK